MATDTNAARLIDFADRHGYPLIAKPRQGFASRGVFLIQNETQLARLAGRPDTILQRYLGERAEVQAYLDGIAPDGSLKGLLATLHAMRQGRSERVARHDDPALLQLGQHCAQAFAAEGWRGPLNIQCQRTPEGDYAIYEYNGRCTGATGARQLLGYDEVGMGLEHFGGIRLPESPAPQCWPDAVQRLPVSRAVEAGWVEALERTGHWKRPLTRENPPG